MDPSNSPSPSQPTSSSPSSEGVAGWLEKAGNQISQMNPAMLVAAAIGWDVVDAGLGVIPLVGDTVGVAPALAILMLGYARKLPPPILLAMSLMVLIDWGLGITPGVGDVVDMVTPATLINGWLFYAATQPGGLTMFGGEPASSYPDEGQTPKSPEGEVIDVESHVVDERSETPPTP